MIKARLVDFEVSKNLAEEVVDSKRSDFYVRHKVRILERFEDWRRVGQDVRSLRSYLNLDYRSFWGLTLSESESFKHFNDRMVDMWESKTIACNDLTCKVLAEYQGRVAGVCLYCGLEGVMQIDHQVPKSEFGEYSVWAINLVPVCGPCNVAKGERWRDIVLVAFDGCMEMLMLKIVFGSFFELKPHEGLDAQGELLVSNTIKCFDLQEKWITFFEKTVEDLAVQYKLHLDDLVLQEYLEEQHRRYVEFRGNNCREAIVYGFLACQTSSFLISMFELC